MKTIHSGLLSAALLLGAGIAPALGAEDYAEFDKPGAVDSKVAEGLITREEAVLRIDPAQLDQLLHPQFDPKAEFKVLAKGLNASPGARETFLTWPKRRSELMNVPSFSPQPAAGSTRSA